MKEKLLLVLLIGFLLEGAYLYHTGNIPYLFNPEVKGVSLSSNAVYWGAYIKGSTYGTGHNDVPWDCTDVTATNCSTWDLFEQHAGKKISILHFGEAWHWTSQTGYAGIGDGYFQKFYSGNFQTIRNHGAIPLIDWSSADLRANPYETQSEYTLAKITSGTYDTYIRQWATDAKAWGKPFFLRFDWEMNGNWYPWSELKNTNTSGQYVAMWRHVHDIFTSVGATNVSWVWCPNISSTDTSVSIPIGNLYPGDAYVDWTCLDGYNKDSGYKTFEQVFKGKGASVPVTYLNDSYQIVTDLAPTKPLMIGETATNEYTAGQKAIWINDALQNQLPTNFPKIKAILWFNWNSDSGSSYVIESSTTSQTAFAASIALPYYASNDFANITTSPIPALSSSTPSPTPTPTPTVSLTPAPTVTPTATPTPTPSPTSSSDTTLPTVSITSPLNNSTVAKHSTITITAAATDNVGVTKVDFYINGKIDCTDVAAPYTCSYDVPAKKGATYNISAKAYDAVGNNSTSNTFVTAQ